MKGRKAHYQKYKEHARALVRGRAHYYARLYGVSLKKIFIKNSKRRWGSCSELGNLNFHYKIAFLPEHIGNYIIVHEICHLKEFNHGQQFWALVAKEVPHYKHIRRLLRRETFGGRVGA